MKLKYESEALPEYLKNKRCRCELHCYDPSISYTVVDLLPNDNILRICSSRLNEQTGEPYPAKQVFFVGEDPSILKFLADIIAENNISSAWVDHTTEIDWNDYYNIEVSRDSDHDKLIKFHQTI